MRDSKKKPEKLRDAKAREKLEVDQRAAIKEAVGSFTREGKAISSTKLVRDQVREDAGLEVGTKLVRQVLKTDLKLSFIKAKKFHPQTNSQRSLVLRQQYALEMLKLHEKRKRIINLDETWLNETSFTRRTWASKGGSCNLPLRSVTPRLSMIAAIDTEGQVWFTLYHANTDSNMIALFLQHLTSALDSESPGWQDDTIVLWDNATYHTSEETRATVRKLGLKVIYSGPYSYDSAPVELLFGNLKLGELNPEQLATGKR